MFDHWNAELERAADHPVVPAGAPDSERWQTKVGRAREDEVIAPAALIELSFAPRPVAQGAVTAGEIEL